MKIKLVLTFLLFLFCEFGYSQKEVVLVEERNPQVDIFHYLVDRADKIVGWRMSQNFDEVKDFTMRKIWINSSQRYIEIKAFSTISANTKSKIIATLRRGVSVSCGTGNYNKHLFLYDFLGKKIFQSDEPLFDDFAPRILTTDKNTLYTAGRASQNKNIILSKYKATGELTWSKLITSVKGSSIVDLFISENEKTIGVVVQIGYSSLRKLFILNKNGEKIIEKELSLSTNYCNKFEFVGNNKIITNDCWKIKDNDQSFDPSIIELNIRNKEISNSYSIPLSEYFGKTFRSIECFPIPKTNRFVTINSKEDKTLIFSLNKNSEIEIRTEIQFSEDIHYLDFILDFSDKGIRFVNREKVYKFNFE